ncbi:hypothetical protein LINPERPRIM_LOCUS7430, partial [Linum perenne]
TRNTQKEEAIDRLSLPPLSLAQFSRPFSLSFFCYFLGSKKYKTQTQRKFSIFRGRDDNKFLPTRNPSFSPRSTAAPSDLLIPFRTSSCFLDFCNFTYMHEGKVAESKLDTMAVMSSSGVTEPQKSERDLGFRLWGWSLFSIIPLAITSNQKTQRPTTINRKLKRRAQYPQVVDSAVGGGGRGNPLRFRPYVSKVPWHTGPRAFLSQLFPRYGHYCGPNWSSGKDQGSLLWDKRPIDWLDYCCYCHDMGYDTHDQAELLKADLKFLECLERPYMVTRGDSHVAHIYKTMSITGLKNILIPYRTHLVKLQDGIPLINFGWLSNVNFRGWKSCRVQGSQQ